MKHMPRLMRSLTYGPPLNDCSQNPRSLAAPPRAEYFSIEPNQPESSSCKLKTPRGRPLGLLVRPRLWCHRFAAAFSWVGAFAFFSSAGSLSYSAFSAAYFLANSASILTKGAAACRMIGLFFVLGGPISAVHSRADSRQDGSFCFTCSVI